MIKEKEQKLDPTIPVLPGANGITESYGQVDNKYFHPSQAYYKVPYNKLDGTFIRRPHYKGENLALRQVEQSMGIVGYLIRTLDRWGAHSAWALIRASEEYPNADYPSKDTVNGMLLANALQINGDGKYVGPKALFHIPEERGIGIGTYNVMDKLHLLFMQEGGLVFKHAEEQCFVYIVGTEDVVQRQRIENMLRSGNYQQVGKQGTASSDVRRFIVGTSPEDGEILTAEIWPLAHTRIDVHPGANYKTTEGMKHGIVVYKKHNDPTTATPVGWIAAFDPKSRHYKLIDQVTTIRMFGLEYLRTEGYRRLSKDKQRELDLIGVGSVSISIEGGRPQDALIHSLIDPSANRKINITSTWTNLYHTYRELAAHRFDPARTQLSTLARIRDSLNKDRRQVNAILTGHVVAQMLAVFYPSLPSAYPDLIASVVPGEDARKLFEPVLERRALPEETLPLWYQIAEYFKLEDANGEDLIYEEGQLAPPIVDNWSASIILSIGVIALEHIVVQYLAPGSIRYGMKSVFGQSLQKMAEAIRDVAFVDSIQLEARRIDKGKTVFGRQRSDCQKLLEIIRSHTGLSTIIDILQNNDYARFAADAKAQQALFYMKKMGTVINESTFAAWRGKGINAGLDVISNHFTESATSNSNLLLRSGKGKIPE